MDNTTFSVECSQETASQIRADADEIGLTVEEFLKALHRMWTAYRAEIEGTKGAE